LRLSQNLSFGKATLILCRKSSGIVCPGKLFRLFFFVMRILNQKVLCPGQRCRICFIAVKIQKLKHCIFLLEPVSIVCGAQPAFAPKKARLACIGGKTGACYGSSRSVERL
jgi:hypothetical protein